MVSFPPNKNKENLGEESSQFVCLSAQIDDNLKDLDENRNSGFLWEYIGSR